MSHDTPAAPTRHLAPFFLAAKTAKTCAHSEQVYDRHSSGALSMNGDTTVFALEIMEIVWIDILLSGDNAILIALACRHLPERQRRLGMLLGAGGGVALRIVFAFIIVQIMAIPFLKTVGGLMLLGVAVKLIVEEAAYEHVPAKESLWGAVTAIILADAVMSLDNVIAIAAAAHGSMMLIMFGLALSVPIVMFGAALFMTVLGRYPLLTWAGAALLGWVAGDLIAEDPLWTTLTWFDLDRLDTIFSIICALIVLLGGWIAKRMESHKHK
jgi:YjbE family integral membrane protein